MFTTESAIDIAATPERVWALWADVPGWPRWNAGVARAALHGPFASGSAFDMQLPDGGPLLHSTLIDVVPNERFTDETAFEGVVVRVTYRTEVEGPGAAEIGAGVSGDFPDVLAVLKRVAEASAMEVACRCGAARLLIDGTPVTQLYCHCDDCRAAHDAAYVAASIHPAGAVRVVQGDLVARVVQTTPRMACATCGTHLFSELADMGLRSVNGFRLPPGRFAPQFHIQCQHAVLPVRDDLPHHQAFPAAFGGSDACVTW